MDKISFDENKDRLWLCGDLVNRGDNSLACLKFINSIQKSCHIVLGNHDLHLLAIAEGIKNLNKSFAILEGRSSLGGTWDLFKYPGVRSDSDMHTLGFRFKPWIHKKSIADGPSILEYLNETVDEYNLREKISFNQK